ncbi:MAG: hypothetical protein AAF383_18475 [Cyanobacteria bacterium P01_A01_bin.83]
MHQVKLYENVVIGNFLYGLGSTVRAKSKSDIVASSVNLLQQTPADKELADVLLEFPGVVRLIEFKQSNNNSIKEKTKLEHLKAMIGVNERLTNISKSIHWFVEITPKNKTFVSRIVPYLYLEDDLQNENQYKLEEFIEDIAEEAINAKNLFKRDELRYYLQLVKKINNKDTNSTSGILLSINSEGKLFFIELTDMLQLRLLDRDYIKNVELRYERENTLNREYSQQQELDRSNRYRNKPDLSL